MVGYGPATSRGVVTVVLRFSLTFTTIYLDYYCAYRWIAHGEEAFKVGQQIGVYPDQRLDD